MKINHKLINSILHICVAGELDEASADYTREFLEALFERSSMNKVVIDLSGLSFMDSTGIGVLIGRFKLLKARQIPLLIANPSKVVDKILSLSGLYTIMPKVVI